MPEISIIVPVYNTEKYLDRCIRSITKQTFSDFELILVDDGSKDNSGFICDEWEKKDSRIKVIHQENAGAGAARNVGLSMAIGNYIGFVDSDDWIEPQMYEVLYYGIKKYSADLAMCNVGVQKSFHQFHAYNEKEAPLYLQNQEEMFAKFFRIHENKSILSVCRRLIDRKILKDFKFIEGTISEDVSAAYYFVTHSQRTVVTDFKFYNYFTNYKGVTKSPITNKDFEYINAYKTIFYDIKKNYPKFASYAFFNYVRSNYTILSKMKLFGYDKSNQVLCAKKKELQKIVRHNFWNLIKEIKPFSRKVLLLYVCL